MYRRPWVLTPVFMLLLSMAAAPAFAQEAPDKGLSAEDQAELKALLSIVEEETEVATKTKMNSDYVPGIVTILNGDDLEALGIRTVWDALSLVPGIQILRSNDTNPSVTVRGMDFRFNSGNIKVTVDGVSLTREQAGVNSAVLFFPIAYFEQILLGALLIVVMIFRPNGSRSESR